MTVNDLEEILSKFDPTTEIVHAVDWSGDVVVLDYTDTSEKPALAFGYASSNDPFVAENT